MFKKIISFEEALKLDNVLFVDTRTSAEFDLAHINGAINIPIFDNEERAEIGYIYTKISKEEATELGLEKASIKLPNFYKKLKEYKDRSIVIYCARGGMRSKTIATTMDLMKLNVYQLEGGYKVYRQYVLEYFDNYKPNFNVLSGNTGCGKTVILKELIKQGLPVIDLEGLANHRGSIFGDIGLGATTTQKNFDGMLFDELKRYEDRPLFIESESRKIGNVTLPKTVHDGIVEGIKINVTSDIEHRVERIKEDYTNTDFNEEDFLYRLDKIKQFMTIEDYDVIKTGIINKDLDEAIKIILTNYYDVLYEKWHKEEDFTLTVSADDLDVCVETLSNFKQKGE